MHLFVFLRRRFLTLFAASCLSTVGAQAQSVQFEVSGVGSGQIPIAVAPFAAEDTAPAKISQIILGDLQRSGQFRSIDATGVLLNENSRPDFKLWRGRTADALAAGSLPSLSEFEQFLRDAGFSKSQATAVASHGLRQMLRDAACPMAKDIFDTIAILKG